MRLFPSTLAALLVIGCSLSLARAAIVVGAHSSEKGNANFSFGGDTTSASTSVASQAAGLIGANSIFGGNGSANDVYVFSYTPGPTPTTPSFLPGPDWAIARLRTSTAPAQPRRSTSTCRSLPAGWPAARPDYTRCTSPRPPVRP